MLNTDAIQAVLTAEGFAPHAVVASGKFTKASSGWVLNAHNPAGITIHFKVCGRTQHNPRQAVVEYARALKARGFTVVVREHEYQPYAFIPAEETVAPTPERPAMYVSAEQIQLYRVRLVAQFVDTLIPLKRRFADAYLAWREGRGSQTAMQQARRFLLAETWDHIERKLDTLRNMNDEQVLLIAQSRSGNGTRLLAHKPKGAPGLHPVAEVEWDGTPVEMDGPEWAIWCAHEEVHQPSKDRACRFCRFYFRDWEQVHFSNHDEYDVDCPWCHEAGRIPVEV